MEEDFHNFKSSVQFDQEKINRFARLDAIPGFCLLRSEKEYLEHYRALLKAETQKNIDDGNASMTLMNEENTDVAPEAVKNDKEPSKKTRKTSKTVITEE